MKHAQNRILETTNGLNGNEVYSGSKNAPTTTIKGHLPLHDRMRGLALCPNGRVDSSATLPCPRTKALCRANIRSEPFRLIEVLDRVVISFQVRLSALICTHFFHSRCLDTQFFFELHAFFHVPLSLRDKQDNLP